MRHTATWDFGGKPPREPDPLRPVPPGHHSVEYCKQLLLGIESAIPSLEGADVERLRYTRQQMEETANQLQYWLFKITPIAPLSADRIDWCVLELLRAAFAAGNLLPGHTESTKTFLRRQQGKQLGETGRETQARVSAVTDQIIREALDSLPGGWAHLTNTAAAKAICANCALDEICTKVYTKLTALGARQAELAGAANAAARHWMDDRSEKPADRRARIRELIRKRIERNRRSWTAS
jgi:hypothetical protein